MSVHLTVAPAEQAHACGFRRRQSWQFSRTSCRRFVCALITQRAAVLERRRCEPGGFITGRVLGLACGSVLFRRCRRAGVGAGVDRGHGAGVVALVRAARDALRALALACHGIVCLQGSVCAKARTRLEYVKEVCVHAFPERLQHVHTLAFLEQHTCLVTGLSLQSMQGSPMLVDVGPESYPILQNLSKFGVMLDLARFDRVTCENCAEAIFGPLDFVSEVRHRRSPSSRGPEGGGNKNGRQEASWPLDHPLHRGCGPRLERLGRLGTLTISSVPSRYADIVPILVRLHACS